MHNVVVVETAQHVYNSICLADVSEELVAESLAFACTFYKTCNIHNVACGRHNASWMNYFGKFVETFIGNGYLSQLCIDCTEGEVCCLCLCT